MANETHRPMLTVSRVYLILYNFFMFLGWSYVFIGTFMHMVVDETYKGAFDAVHIPLYIFQTGALLEILHAALGLVRSNPVLTAFQVSSRIFLVWGICFIVPQIHNTIGVPMFLYAWSITEIIRYSYYAYGLLGATPPILTWCRYTFFIILYPIGVTGELLTVYASLEPIKQSGVFSLRLPNRINWGFDYHIACIVIMLSYIPVFPQLYLHMFAQRKKIIGGAQKKEQ